MTHHNNLPPGVTERDCEPRNPCDEHDDDECGIERSECELCGNPVMCGIFICSDCEDEE